MAIPNKHGEVKISADFVEMIVKVAKHFEGDYRRTRLWLITPNLNLGGLAPLKLYTMGKGQRILEFIDNAKKSE